MPWEEQRGTLRMKPSEEVGSHAEDMESHHHPRQWASLNRPYPSHQLPPKCWSSRNSAAAGSCWEALLPTELSLGEGRGMGLEGASSQLSQRLGEGERGGLGCGYPLMTSSKQLRMKRADWSASSSSHDEGRWALLLGDPWPGLGGWGAIPNSFSFGDPETGGKAGVSISPAFPLVDLPHVGTLPGHSASPQNHTRGCHTEGTKNILSSFSAGPQL